MQLAVTYAILSLIATATNIGAQDVFIRIWPWAYGVPLSIAAGTGVGLVVKYVLDKRYIFKFVARDVAHDTQTFALYTLMGLLTTCIFWGFEFGFHLLFGTKEARYLGAVIGLSIGYLSKYHLDRRYVFRVEQAG